MLVPELAGWGSCCSEEMCGEAVSRECSGTTCWCVKADLQGPWWCCEWAAIFTALPCQMPILVLPPLGPLSLAYTILQRNFCSHGGALTHDITIHFFRVIPFPSTSHLGWILVSGAAWKPYRLSGPGFTCRLLNFWHILSTGAALCLLTKQRSHPDC